MYFVLYVYACVWNKGTELSLALHFNYGGGALCSRMKQEATGETILGTIQLPHSYFILTLGKSEKQIYWM